MKIEKDRKLRDGGWETSSTRDTAATQDRSGHVPTDSEGADERAKRIEEYKKQARKDAYPTWIDLLVIVGIVIVSTFAALMLVWLGSLFAVEADENLTSLILYVLQFGLSIFFVNMYQRYRGMKKNLIRFNVRGMNLPLILWGVVLIFAAGIVIEPLLELFPASMLDRLDDNIGRGGWAILSVVVCAPIFEEILFRGQILGAIKEKQGKAIPAVLISSLIFGLMHLPIPQQMVNAMVIGVIIGFIYVRTDSLVAVILIHAINNGLAYVLRELFGSTANSASTRELIPGDVWYYIVYGLSVVLFALGLYGMIKSIKKLKQVPSGEAPAFAGNDEDTKKHPASPESDNNTL